MAASSRFRDTKGILFAADLPTEEIIFSCLDAIAPHLAAVKLGNAVLYTAGAILIKKIKSRYGLPVIADLKLTDVSHVAIRVVDSFAARGADAVIVAGMCGREVLSNVVRVAEKRCEIWIFTEFTNDSGMIDPALADRCVQVALDAGVVGFQAPGTRPHRVEDVRADVGNSVTIAACGIGVQGGRFGSAISAGANLEIIGRAIYSAREPAIAAAAAKHAILQAALTALG